MRKARVAPVGLGEVVAAPRRFLAEPYLAAARGEPFTRRWPAGGPWGCADARGLSRGFRAAVSRRLMNRVYDRIRGESLATRCPHESQEESTQ